MINIIRKDRYWVLKSEEMDIVIQLLQTHPAMLQLQQGSAINALFAAMNKAEQEKLAAEQQPVDAEPEPEQQTYAQNRQMPAPPQPPRRGVAAKVSQTQPPVPPQPPRPIQKKKPNFVTRQAQKEEIEEPSSEEEETQSDDGNEVEESELLDEMSDEDF
jgi:hypothetical protein